MVFDVVHRTVLVGLQYTSTFFLSPLELDVLKIEALFVVRIFRNICCVFVS